MDFTYLSEQRSDILYFSGKTEDDMKSYVTILREWMEKQPHLPSELLQDEFLEQHIIKNKFYIEKVKNKIENYCTMKNKRNTRYLFENYTLTPSREPQFYVPMPNLTDNYHRVIINKIWDDDRYDMKSDTTNMLVLRELIARYDYSLGEIHIIDLSNCSIKILTQLRANLVADGMPFIFKCYSTRIIGVHIISTLAATLVTWFKPLLPAKIASRFVAHDNADLLTNFIPAKCLPKDYGGDLKSLRDFMADMDETYSRNKDKITSYVNTTAREEFRQGGSIPEEMKGTFMKLNID